MCKTLYTRFLYVDQEELFLAKAKRLSKEGKSVTLIVCYDDYNPYKKLRSEIDEDQHFLFDHLRNQVAQQENIALEFVYVWNLIEYVPQLTANEINTFVFEFTFLDSTSEEKIEEYTNSIDIPEV